MTASDDASTRERLIQYTWDSDGACREAILRALAAREDDVPARTVFFVRLLGDTKDAAGLSRSLDVPEPALHRAMLPMLGRLKDHEGRRVETHFQADRTQTGYVYVLRTRTQVPEEYDDPAKAGGTGRSQAVD